VQGEEVVNLSCTLFLLKRVVNLKLIKNGKYILSIIFLIILFLIPFTSEANEMKGESRIISLEEVDSLMVKIKFGIGELVINPGEKKDIFEGNFQYERSLLKPNVHYEIIGTKGYLNLSQSIKEDIDLWPSYKNRWSLKLPSDIPLQIYINTAAYIGEINLTNLKIENFYLNSGASQTNIVFDQPNLIDLKNINIKTGASTVKISGLANANFDMLDFAGGAGRYTFDFSGNLTKKSKVNIDTGAAKVILKIPSTIGTRIIIKRFPTTKLDIAGFIKINDQTYINPEYGKRESELNIEIKGGFIDVEMFSS